MSWSKPVFSSHVKSVGFNPDTAEIEITWANGRVSAYGPADEGTALAGANSPSIGEWLHNEIKPNYNHRYIR